MNAVDLRPFLVAAGWALLGAAAGYGIHRLSAWLARREELVPGRRWWHVWGPAVVGAAVFAVFGWRFAADPMALLVRSLWAAVLVQVIFFDFEHRLVLDRVMFPSWAAALVLSFATGDPGWKWSLVGGIGAGVAFAVLALFGALVFRAEVLGMGDIKLAVFIGLVSGAYTAQALLLGVILAGFTSIVLMVIRIKSLKDTIAYGPYLCIGTLVVLLERVPK